MNVTAKFADEFVVCVSLFVCFLISNGESNTQINELRVFISN